MSVSDSRRPKGKRKGRVVTEVRCVDDLQFALKTLAAERSKDVIHELERIFGALKREFDPTTVTMNSTNIPDAVTKLSSVVAETQQATTRVFQLVERQRCLLEENDADTAALEELLKSGAINPVAALELVSKSRATHKALREVSHEIVVAQEFQDLCSQKIEKVIKLLGFLDGNLRTLLTHFTFAPVFAQATEGDEDNADIGQSDADDILKGFGI